MGFKIRNFFNKIISVHITGERLRMVTHVRPNEEKHLTTNALDKGTTIKVFDGMDLLQDFILVKPSESLATGQVATMLVREDGEYNLQAGMASVALQSRPHIWIHNETKKLLRLNHNICVPPLSKYKYCGMYSRGIPLGLRLTDQDGLYPEVVLKEASSDVMYGVATEY